MYPFARMFFYRHQTERHFQEACNRPAAETHQGFASAFVTAQDGLTLHVRRYGSRHASAHSVVCLPGLARTAADFHPLATALAADPANPRLVLALDYRGHGQSQYDRTPKNYAIRVALADLSAVLAALEITSATVVGTSFGGILAMSDSKNNLWMAEFTEGHLGKIDAKTTEVTWYLIPTPKARGRRMSAEKYF